MPWIKIETRYTDPEWIEQLQQEAEEAERRERLYNAFQAHTHTQNRNAQRQEVAR